MTKQPDFPHGGRALVPGNDTTRIAAALRSVPQRLDDGEPQVDAALVEAVLRARALRSVHLPRGLLSDPAWDMLLELFHGELTKRRITASKLATAANVSSETGRRWIAVLQGKALCEIEEIDRNEVRLTEEGSRTMHAYFTALAGRGFEPGRDAGS